MLAPGDCSPSRSVVSKMTMFRDVAVLSAMGIYPESWVKVSCEVTHGCRPLVGPRNTSHALDGPRQRRLVIVLVAMQLTCNSPLPNKKTPKAPGLGVRS